MSFGMCNALYTFQRMMSDILREISYKFVTVYFDHICVYSRILEERLEHLRLLLQRFKEKGLRLRLKNCFFGLQQMEYLGYIVSAGKTSVSNKKGGAVANLAIPTTQKEVRSFGQFCNLYASSSVILATLRLH
jgi:hypothetical protein